MNEPLPCAGCPTMLPPEARTCPNCLRARTDEEIALGYARLRTQAAPSGLRPFKVAAVALILATAGRIAWNQRPEPGTIPAGSSPRAAVTPQDVLAHQRFSAPQETGATRAVAAPVKKSPPSSDEWRVSGTIYDLATLAPVPGAAVTFAQNANKSASAITDEKGFYEIDIAKGPDWTVSVQSSQHRPGQIIDIDPPYRTRDSDERNAVIEHISDGDLAPAAVGWDRKNSMAHLDLVAVPSR